MNGDAAVIGDAIIIQSEAVRFRRSAAKDLDFILALERAEENRKFIGQWTREQHASSFADRDILHLIVEMLVEDNKTMTPVGYAIIKGLTSPDDSIELMRVVIADKGKGYGREALRLVKKLAFEELKAHRLWLDVRSHNERAKRLYQSEGFIKEGVLRECKKTEKGYESLEVLSMLAREYLF